MNFIVWFLLCFCIITYWPIHIVAKTPHTALIFSSKTYKLEEINHMDLNKNCYSCLTACPAKSKREKKFNNKVSLAQSSVFFRNVYQNVELAKNIDIEICTKMFRPSILFHEKSDLYSTGYELYYEEEKCELVDACDPCDYKDFKSLLNSDIKKHKTFPKIVSEKTMKFKFTNENIMSFYWIPVLFFKFNSIEYQIRITFYGDAINDYVTIFECKDYKLGYKFANFFYATSNPEEMFDKIDFAAIQSSNSQTESSCAQPDKCLERTHILPMMFFHTKAAKLATCTYWNTVPVWSSVVDGQLKFVDRYLYTIFRLWHPYIDIVFGVSGELTLNNVQNLETAPVSSLSNDQNHQNRIKIPKIIYRIVEYHSSYEMMNENDDQNANDGGQNDEKKKDLNHYVAIIIHNDPNASIRDIICPMQISLLFNDWKAIQNRDAKKGLSYACTLNNETIKKLGAYDEAPPDFTQPIYLSAFPFYEHKGSTIILDYVDGRKRIDDEMKKLFPEEVL